MAAPALIFDLDGTLVDSVYQHVLAWHEALQECGIELSVWRIHRRIGMSGGLFTRALLRETGRALDEALLARLQERHAEAYRRALSGAAAARGARAAGAADRGRGEVGDRDQRAQGHAPGRRSRLLGVPEGVPVVTRDLVPHAKPDPDLFLEAAAPARRRGRAGRRGRRQRLGHAGGAARAHARGRRAVRRLRHRRAGARGGVSGVRGPGRPLAHLDEVGVR